MAIVTISIKKETEVQNKAWFQVIDDINSENIDTIKYIANKSDIVIGEKFSNPIFSEDVDKAKSEKLNELYQETNKKIQELNISETQRKNLQYKFKYWALNDFKILFNNIENTLGEKHCAVIIIDKVKNHEWLFLQILQKLGINILLITKDLSNYSTSMYNIDIIKYNTNENLKIDKSKTDKSDEINTIIKLSQIRRQSRTVSYIANKNSELNEHSQLDKNTLEFKDITKEYIISNDMTKEFSNSEILRLSIAGTDATFESLRFAAQLRDLCKDNDNYFFIDGKIGSPTIDETSKIYKLTKDDINYIAHTMKNFIKCSNKNIENKVREMYHELAIGLYNLGDNAHIVYNKSVTLICWLNRYLKYDNVKIVFYGNPKGNDKILLEILEKLYNVSIIVINAESKTDYFKFNNGNNIELLTETKNLNLDLVSTNTATTMAYNANKMVDQTLFNGDTLGMYREGQIVGCNTKHLACTFDEIVLWWNKEMFIRPGFVQHNNIVDIPVQFGIIRGVKGDEKEYKKLIQRYCCGKTTLYYNRWFYPCFNNTNGKGMRIHNCTDINRTMFSSQKPFVMGGKLQTELIKSGINYRYGFLDIHKQEFIFSKIQELLDDNMLIIPNEFRNKNDFYNLLLNITLNLDIELLRTIQWFNYTDYNPNIVVISDTEEILSFEDVLYLRFLSKLGFDILVFVPTQYTSVENYLNNSEYEIYNIGRPEYSLNIKDINVVEDVDYAQKQEEKKGWLNKLFK